MSAAALQRACPVLCLGSVGDMVWYDLPPGQYGRADLGRLHTKKAGSLTNSVTSQAQVQPFELAHHKIYHTYDLPECIKVQKLHNQSCRISMTQKSNNRMLQRNLDECLVLMRWQKSEASNQSSDLLQWILASNFVWTKGAFYVTDLLCHTIDSIARWFSFFKLFIGSLWSSHLASYTHIHPSSPSLISAYHTAPFLGAGGTPHWGGGGREGNEQDKVQNGEYTVVPGLLPGWPGTAAILMGGEVRNQRSEVYLFLGLSVPGREGRQRPGWVESCLIESECQVSRRCWRGESLLGRLIHSSGISRYLISMEVSCSMHDSVSMVLSGVSCLCISEQGHR